MYSSVYVLQISDIGLTLNPRAGERAVLIKNFEGDWGLVTGKWTGFRKGVAGRKGTLPLSMCFGNVNQYVMLLALSMVQKTTILTWHTFST